MKIGLLPIAEQIAALAIEEARRKKSGSAQRRISAAVLPLLEEAALAGFQQAQIAVGPLTEAALILARRKRELVDPKPVA